MADAPQLSLPLEATVEPAALVLARRLAPLLSASPVSREALRPHVQNRTVGPAVGVSSAAGLARLRLPLEWVLSPSVAEALFGASSSTSSEEEMIVSVERVGLVADVAMAAVQPGGTGAQLATGEVGGTLRRPPLPASLEVAVGAVEVGVVAAGGGGAVLANASVGALSLRHGAAATVEMA